MVAVQTPTDVVKWMQASLEGRSVIGGIWTSLDYSDFNKEHSKIVLALLNMLMAEQWMEGK